MPISRGKRRYLVTLSGTTTVADGDGGFTEVITPLVPPTRRAEIKPATARDLERVTAGTTLSTESLLITMPFHPLVTTKTRVTWTDLAGRAHSANLTGVNNPEERCRELICVAVEVVT